MQNLIVNITVINSFLILLAGSVMYFVDKKKAQHSIWLVYSIVFCIWNFCFYKTMTSDGGMLTKYWLMTSLSALIFIPPIFLHFLSAYSDKEIFRKQILGKIYIIFFLFFAVSFILPDEFIKKVTTDYYFGFSILPGTMFNVFTFVFFGFTFCGFYYLIHSAKMYLGFKRNQRMWIFLGMLIGLLAPINFFLSVYRINFFPFGIFCIAPYIAIVGYTLLKFHVAEMEIAINKTVALAYFTLFVLFIHMFIVHVLHRMVGVNYFTSSIISGGIVLVNLLFVAHYAGLIKLNKVTERIVYDRKINYYHFLEQFTAYADKITDIKDLSSYILDSLVEIVGLESAVLYLHNEDIKDFEIAAYKGINKEKLKEAKHIAKNDPFIKFLSEGNIYVAKEAPDFSEEYNTDNISKSFKDINVTLSVPIYYGLPLFHEREMVGFLNLGDKKNKEHFTPEDMDILNAFGRQLSSGIDKIKLYSHAITDDLTKLYRVGYLNERIQEEIARANRYSRPFSVAMMDVDDFKAINDRFGHQVGDNVLKKVAYAIKEHARKADVAARYGGEEFCVLMPETNLQSAIMGAERIRKAVLEEFQKDNKFKITVSVGVSEYKEGMKKYELVKVADDALYKAKREGKNRVIG